MDTSRRDLLTWIGRAAAGVFLCGGAVLGARFLKPPRTRDLGRRAALGLAAALPPGTALHLAEHDVHVFHGPQGLSAISGRCTHLGCSLLLEPEGFACPCHGARFDRDGRPLSGPAPRPLTWYRVSVDGEQRAWVHLDEPVPGGTATRI